MEVAATDSEPYVLKPPKSAEYSEGLEIQIMRTIADYYNFKIEYKELPIGESPWVFDSNGTIVGLFGLLHRKEADLLFHGVRLRIERLFEIGEALTPHFEDELVWVVPYRLPWSKWNFIFKVFPSVL